LSISPTATRRNPRTFSLQILDYPREGRHGWDRGMHEDDGAVFTFCATLEWSGWSGEALDSPWSRKL
ncbi:MAG: hypothetical protein K6U03_10425, partial [Firmicutes bacterium]|nr:hypothetical protein [Bacillota bacterium]